jgi:hypothetical protein
MRFLRLLRGHQTNFDGSGEGDLLNNAGGYVEFDQTAVCPTPIKITFYSNTAYNFSVSVIDPYALAYFKILALA